jgi:hypothetical protein
LALVAGCGSGSPLDDLSAADRAYLFADSETSHAFMGQPADGGALDCEAARMNQAYVLVDTAHSLWLDSVRPSGVERHRIVKVTGGGDRFEISAENGAGAPFALQVRRVGELQADISWDGAPAARYLRCPGPPPA